MSLPVTSSAVLSRQRLATIGRQDVAALRADPVIAATVEAAARALDLPIALLTFVLDVAQLHIADFGVEGWVAEAGGLPIEWSFCRHSVESREPLLIEDALADERVRDSAIVADGVRCYAGVPMEVDGEVLGSLCVLGTEPRSFSAEDVALLAALRDRVRERVAVLAGD